MNEDLKILRKFIENSKSDFKCLDKSGPARNPILQITWKHLPTKETYIVCNICVEYNFDIQQFKKRMVNRRYSLASADKIVPPTEDLIQIANQAIRQKRLNELLK